jgi:carotenoid cleavage dioxygenase-like enzyme
MLRVIAQATRTVAAELSGVACRVEGGIPRALDEILLRNGPGRTAYRDPCTLPASDYR